MKINEIVKTSQKFLSCAHVFLVIAAIPKIIADLSHFTQTYSLMQQIIFETLNKYLLEECWGIISFCSQGPNIILLRQAPCHGCVYRIKLKDCKIFLNEMFYFNSIRRTQLQLFCCIPSSLVHLRFRRLLNQLLT